MTVRAKVSLVPAWGWGRSFALVAALGAVAGLVAAALSLVHREEVFDAVVQITKKTIVEADAQGVPQLVDVELEWDACPGDQVQVVRGGAEFAKCFDRVKPGDYAFAKVTHLWDTRGFFRWDLSSLGDCSHPIERDTPGSYERSQECESTASHGYRDGFVCNRRPFKDLLAVCPFMGR